MRYLIVSIPNTCFVTFLYGVSGQVRYLIVLIPSTCFCQFPIWCPGSGEVFDCIDS